MSKNKACLGVIGGSGIYEIDGVTNGKWVSVPTPFGMPSDDIFTGTLNGIDVAFLPRHGRNHTYSPTNVPYQANIYALKDIGVTDILSVSACGSLRPDYKPGDFVVIDQFIDRTFSRQKTFFDRNCVAHVSLAKPVCNRLAGTALQALEDIGVRVHHGGTYLAMEGPQFSTVAESLLYKDVWHCDVIGMTNMPEAKLAREAEICYATIAMITDYDCWHPEHDNVEVSDVIAVLKSNATKAKDVVKKITSMIDAGRDPCPHGCDTALEYAIISNLDEVPQKELDRLAGLIAKNLERHRSRS